MTKVGARGVLSCHATAYLPAPLERQAREHRGLARPDGRAVHRLNRRRPVPRCGRRDVPEPREHVHAAQLELSAVCGYSSLSIMFLSKRSVISRSASGSIHVVMKVARLSRAFPSSMRWSCTTWQAEAGSIPDPVRGDGASARWWPPRAARTSGSPGVGRRRLPKSSHRAGMCASPSCLPRRFTSRRLCSFRRGGLPRIAHPAARLTEARTAGYAPPGPGDTWAMPCPTASDRGRCPASPRSPAEGDAQPNRTPDDRGWLSAGTRKLRMGTMRVEQLRHLYPNS